MYYLPHSERQRVKRQRQDGTGNLDWYWSWHKLRLMQTYVTNAYQRRMKDRQQRTPIPDPNSIHFIITDKARILLTFRFAARHTKIKLSCHVSLLKHALERLLLPHIKLCLTSTLQYMIKWTCDAVISSASMLSSVKLL